MEFEIQRDVFNTALKLLASVADRKSTMPVLANVLLRTDGAKRLFAAASELTVTMAVNLECTSSKEGSITVNARQIAEIVDAVVGETVKIKCDGLAMELRCGRSRFSLTGISERDFPRMPELSSTMTKMTAPTLLALVKKATYAVLSGDQNRPHLCGANVMITPTLLRVESTDGNRCVFAQSTLEGGPNIPSAIVPRRGLDEIGRVLEGVADVSVGIQAGRFIIQTDHITLWSNTLDGPFAPIDAVTRKTSTTSVIAPRLALKDLVHRVSLAAGAEGHLAGGVRLLFGDNAIAAAAQSSTAIGNDSIQISFDGDNMEIGCNAKYLMEALDKLVGDEVRIDLDGSESPLQLHNVEADGAMAIIMPMRLHAAA